MQHLNKFFKFLGVTALVFSLGVINIAPNKLPRAISNSGFLSSFHSGNIFNQANADILTGDSGTGSQVELIRFLYLLINGPASSGYPSGFSGPDDGLLGLIRDITGPTALGGGLTDAGYSTCASIPDTGNAVMTESDGSQFNMYFETPLISIPSGYTGAGGTFAKRVTVQYRSSSAGTYATFMNIEFQCTTNVGWLRFFENGQAQTTARNVEVYWDTNSTSATKMELYMYYEAGVGTTNGNEYFVAKFETGASNTFKFWITRGVDNTSDQGMRAAAYGNSSSKLVNAFLLFTLDVTNTNSDHTDVGDNIFTGDVQCLDISNVAAVVASASCTGTLDLDASAGTPIIDASGVFSIFWTADTTNGMKQMMTAIVEPS